MTSGVHVPKRTAAAANASAMQQADSTTVILWTNLSILFSESRHPHAFDSTST
jgi:hypothetical protein